MTSKQATKVLLLQNDPGDARQIRELLADTTEGRFSLKQVDRLSAALQCLEEGGVDVVLLDLTLPDSQGPDTFGRIHKYAPRVPVVILTGFYDEDVAAEAVRQGAQDYLFKGQVDGRLLARSIRSGIARKRGEEALRESEARYQDLYDNAPDMYASVEPASATVLECNRTLTTALGYSKEEILGLPVFKLYHPDCLEEAQKAFHCFVQTGEVIDAELQLRRKDGSKIDVSLNVSAVRDEEGKILHSRSSWHDITERRLAREALRECDSLLKEQMAELDHHYRTAPIGLCLMDTDLRFFRINDQLAAINGVPVADHIGRTLREVHPAIADKVEPIYRRVIESGEAALDVEMRGTTATAPDVQRDWLVSYCPLKRDDGTVYAVTTVVLDVTERTRADHALRESEEKYRRLIENLPESYFFYRHGTEGVFTYLSTSVTKVLGYTVEEYLSDYDDHFTDNEINREAVRRTELGLQDTRQPPYELEVYHKDGSARMLEIQEMPVYGEDGAVVALEGVARDITERKRTEQLLRDRTLQQTAVAELGRYALAGVDLNALLSEAVRRVAATLGVEYCTVMELLPGGEELLLRAGIGEKGYVGRARVGVDVNSQAGYTLSVDKPVLVDDLREETRFTGTALPLEHNVVSGVSVVIPGDESRFGVLGAYTSTRRAFTSEEASFLEAVANILADAVEQKRADEKIRDMYLSLERRVAERTTELEAANRELEAFTYSVSHDLKQPLRSIDGYARMLHEDSAHRLDHEGRSQLDRIRTATAKMGSLIEDLLAFSQAGRAELQPGVIDTGELLKTVYEELKSEAAERRIELRLGSLPQIHGDRTLIRQVFTNLLSNAIKFTGTRDTAIIEAGCRAESNEDIYYMKDNGAGFDMAYADKLFGVFQRLHYADEFPGTGVGLAIVQRIIERHGGRVWAEGKVDEGATLYFALPRQPIAR